MNNYYLIKESFIGSIIADAATVTMVLGGAVINKFFLGDSIFFNSIFVVMMIIFVKAKVKSKIQIFRSNSDLINYLEGKEVNGQTKANDRAATR